MKPETILAAYTKAVLHAQEYHDDAWDYLAKGLYWRAASTWTVREIYVAQYRVFYRRLMRLLAAGKQEYRR